MVERSLSISEAQKELTRLPEEFAQDSRAITITRYGKPVMAILPFETYMAVKKTIEELQETVEGLQETIEILKDEELMAAFRQGVKDIEEGNWKTLDEVMKQLGWE